MIVEKRSKPYSNTGNNPSKETQPRMSATAEANSRAWSRCLAALSHADLLLYIQEVEKEKKKLQEENAELKAEKKELHDQVKSVVRDEDWEEDIAEVVENLVLKIDVLEELVEEA